MLTWAEYADRVIPFIESGPYNATSIKSLKYIFNRLRRQLDIEDLFDPPRLMRYRRQLPPTVVGNVDQVLRFMRTLDDDPKVPLPLRRTPWAYPHPLFADVMALGAVFDNHKLPGMTWGDLSNVPPFEKVPLAHAARIWEWWMGTDNPPTEKSALIPVSGDGRGIRDWEVAYIINSMVEPQSKMTHRHNPAFEPMMRAIEVLVALEASAEILRDVCVAIGRLGKNTARHDWKSFYGVLKEIEVTRDPLTLWFRVQKFPRDPEVDADLLW